MTNTSSEHTNISSVAIHKIENNSRKKNKIHPTFI